MLEWLVPASMLACRQLRYTVKKWSEPTAHGTPEPCFVLYKHQDNEPHFDSHNRYSFQRANIILAVVNTFGYVLSK